MTKAEMREQIMRGLEFDLPLRIFKLNEFGNLQVTNSYELEPKEAIQLAHWILDTFEKEQDD